MLTTTRKRRVSNKRRILLLIAAILAISVAGYVAYASTAHVWPFETHKTQDATNKDTGSDASDDSSQGNVSPDTNDKAPDDSADEYVDTDKTPDSVPQSPTLGVSINSLKHENGYVSYSASVSGTKQGVCAATFTNKIGKPVVKNRSTTNGTCSAKIRETEFDALGAWKLTLNFYSDNKKATATKGVTIQ